MNPSTPNADDIYQLALLYEEQHADFTEDLDFHCQLAASYGGPILELGVGGGRVGLHLARAGFNVTGIDLQPAMVALANQRAAEQAVSSRFKAVCGDVRHIDQVISTQSAPFSLVICPFNSLSHLLTSVDLQACLAGVRQCLHTDGAFVPSLFVPRPIWLYSASTGLRCIADFWSESLRQAIVVYEQNRYDPITQLNHLNWYFEPQGAAELWERSFALRLWYPQELAAQLTHAGLTVAQILGDYSTAPATADSLVFSSIALRKL
jgi:SAM-dependent methyltransferase